MNALNSKMSENIEHDDCIDYDDTEEEMIDFYLPVSQSDRFKNFATLPSEEKIRVIELGQLVLDLCSQQTNVWNNKELEEKLTELNKQHNEEQKSLSDIIQREKARHKTELENIIKETQEHTQLQFNEQIQKLQTEIEGNKSIINNHNESKMELMRDLYKQRDDKLEEQRKMFCLQIDELRSNFEKKLLEEREKTNEHIMRSSNSTIIGQDGENFLFHQLNLLFPNATVEDCHKQPERGDFIIRDKDMCIMIETKNYTKNVPIVEQRKFYRDMENESNHDINGGLFLSMKSGIANKEDLTFETVNGKPVIFMHNLMENISSLKIAYRFIKTIIEK